MRPAARKAVELLRRAFATRQGRLITVVTAGVALGAACPHLPPALQQLCESLAALFRIG